METTDAETAAVIDAARGGEPDRYLAALLSPGEQRAELLALAAFSAELSNIPLRVVHEPTMGEIRLQWWHDALAMPPPLRTGNPVADAVRSAVLRRELPTRLIEATLDARSLLLGRTAALAPEEFTQVLWGTQGALFALSASLSGVALSPEIEAGCRSCGEAYGMARLLYDLPRLASQGILPLPADQLDAAGLRAEDLLAGVSDERVQRLAQACSERAEGALAASRKFARALPRPNRAAFLPLALVTSYLRVVKRSGPALLREQTHVTPLVRVSRIAAARVLGRW